MPKEVKLTEARVQKASVPEVRVQEQIGLTAHVDRLQAPRVDYTLRPGKLTLKDVQLELEVSLSVEWNLRWDLRVPPVANISGNKNGTLEFTPFIWRKPLEAPNVPVIDAPNEIRVRGDALRLDRLEATVEPIVGAQLGAFLANAVAENVVTGKITLTPEGNSLESLEGGATALSGLRIDELILGRLSSKVMPIPKLTLPGFKLPSSPPAQAELPGTRFKQTFPPSKLPGKSVRIDMNPNMRMQLDLVPTLASRLTVTLGGIRMENVVISGGVSSLSLEKLDLTFEGRGLKLAPIQLDGVTAQLDIPPKFHNGPLYGGTGGTPFQDELEPVKRLARVTVRSGTAIDSLQATYELMDGRMQDGVKHGGTGGAVSVLNLAPGESIVRIEGEYGQWMSLGTDVVTYLRFVTSGGNSLSCGTQFQGQHPFTIEGFPVLGFHGRSAGMVDAIGIRYR